MVFTSSTRFNLNTKPLQKVAKSFNRCRHILNVMYLNILFVREWRKRLFPKTTSEFLEDADRYHHNDKCAHWSATPKPKWWWRGMEIAVNRILKAYNDTAKLEPTSRHSALQTNTS